MILKPLVNKGISLTSVMFTLTVFSTLFLVFNRWTASQRQSAVKIYHDFQALQIAENQAQRQFLGLSCEQQAKQNGIAFQIQCQGNRVVIRSPQGEFP
ncbi:membrane protein [Rodentibacter pneumotropicus]|uniref:Membrane protein n=1 Tax=Rodentibacter pneumotropicus TaxID=758 RepID=A0A448MQR2_9PAST|nr:membrane protein [Rodentibacter pneumotropicus]